MKTPYTLDDYLYDLDAKKSRRERSCKHLTSGGMSYSYDDGSGRCSKDINRSFCMGKCGYYEEKTGYEDLWPILFSILFNATWIYCLIKYS